MEDKMIDYILNMDEVEFRESFSKMAHSLPFSAIVSGSNDNESINKLRNTCMKIGVPEYVYKTDEIFINFLKK